MLSQAKSDEPNVHSGWSIAIHGGAGSAATKWDDKKRAVRKAGLERALTAGKEILSEGGKAIDAVEAVIKVMEDDASFNAGRGAVLTDAGEVELDASIMDGSNHQCGAVAGVTQTQNPISLARRVMTQTKHVLLTGDGADEFARQQKVQLVEPDYFQTSYDNTYKRVVPPDNRENDELHFGTVGCVALDSHGDLAAGTSTGGTSKKLPGRVGDSPIIGAGTYASNDTCAVSGTGIGEEYIRNSVAYDLAARMRYANQSLASAVNQTMKSTLEKGVGGLIAIDHNGTIVLQHNTPGMSCGAADSSGRFETMFAVDDPKNTPDQQSPASQATAEITALIQQQAADWSNGDIDAFMSAYWKSEDLTFSSGGKVTRGWEATLAGYKKKYPNKETMGRVTFTDLEFLVLSESAGESAADSQAPSSMQVSAMQVIGTWQLERKEAPIGGKFTLVLRKIQGQWRIVHDHTSLKAQ